MITGVSYAGKPLDNTTMYITKKVEHLIINLKNVKGCKVFVENTIIVPDELKQNNEFVYTDTPQRDYAAFIQQIETEILKKNKNRNYTHTNMGYVVGENIQIGNNAYIEPGVFIDHDVIIGDNAHLKTGTIIRNAVIGNNFVACENCTIGTNGFTMASDENNNKIRIPSLGKVIIGDNVEINSLTNISRGSAGDTTIGNNVKIDSLVHVGHDVCIKSNSEITAGTILGGYVEIGENVFVGINSSIRNRKNIGSDVFVGMGSVVTKNIERNITVVGNPAHELIK